MDWDKSRSKGEKDDKDYYRSIATRISDIKEGLHKDQNGLREHAYLLIKDYKANVAEGDPYKMLKWTDGLKYNMMEREKSKEDAKKLDWK